MSQLLWWRRVKGDSGSSRSFSASHAWEHRRFFGDWLFWGFSIICVFPLAIHTHADENLLVSFQEDIDEYFPVSFEHLADEPGKEEGMFPLTTKLAGVQFDNAQENIKKFCCQDIPNYSLIREPGNPYDSNAVKVMLGNLYLGYLPKSVAAKVASYIDNGTHLVAEPVRINESPYHKMVGMMIRIVEV